MRNLKRALSLALASVMVASMTLIGAGAVSINDFSDSADIVNTEAVTVLATLGVITGKDDGSYDPAGTITRGEMSTIICRVLNSGKDPVLGESVSNTYSDTASHWAKSYIEYCTTLGIVAGKGDGTFDPNGDVTVAEAAKMVLVALGYNAAIEGYTGGNWQINVDARANRLGLYDALDYTNTSAVLTRDNAAQMLYNALDCDKVEYEYVLDTTNGTLSGATQIKSDSTLGTLLEEEFDAVKVEGVVVANEVANLSTNGALDENRTRIRVTNYDDQEYYGNSDGTKAVDFATTTGMDELGRSVMMYVKKNTTSTRAEVLGSVILSQDNNVVTDYSSDPIADVADDNNMDLDNTDTLVAVNYGSADNYGDYTDPKTAGVEKILIDNDDDSEVDYVLMNEYRFGKVTSYVSSGDGSIAVNVGDSTFTSDDADDVVGFENVARNDYVIAIEVGGKLYVEQAETVTGTLDAWKTNKAGDTTKLTVDGEEYNVSHITGYTGSTDVIKAAKEYDDTYLDIEATFYMTKGGYIAAVGEVDENAYNYALVLATGTNGLEDRVRVALSDGTVSTYDFVTTGNAEDDPKVGEVYRYTMTSDGDIRLSKNTINNNGDAEGGSALGDVTFEKGKTTIKAGSSTYYASANTPFFYVGMNDTDWGNATDNNSGTTPNDIDSDVVNVYTGYANAPDLDNTKDITAKVYVRDGDANGDRASGSRVGAVVFYGDADLATNKVDNVLYLDSIISRTSSYTNAWVFLNDSAERQQVKLDGNYYASDEGVSYTWTQNPDGTYDIKTVPAGNEAKNVTVSDTSATTFVANNVEYVITNETLIVDDSYYMDTATGELSAGPNEGDVLKSVVFNNDNEAVMIVVANEEPADPAVISTVTNADADDAVALTTAGGTVDTVTSNTPTPDNRTYQWYDADTNTALVEGTNFTGTKTATLTAVNGIAADTYKVFCRVTNTDKNGNTNYKDSDTITVTVTVPETVLLNWTNETDFKVYADDAYSPLETIATRNGFGVELPEGISTISIQVDSGWDQYGQVELGGETYVVDENGCITLTMDQVNALASKTLDKTALTGSNYTAPIDVTLPASGLTVDWTFGTDLNGTLDATGTLPAGADVTIKGLDGTYYVKTGATDYAKDDNTEVSGVSGDLDLSKKYVKVAADVTIDDSAVLGWPKDSSSSDVKVTASVNSGEQYVEVGTGSVTVDVTLTGTISGGTQLSTAITGTFGAEGADVSDTASKTVIDASSDDLHADVSSGVSLTLSNNTAADVTITLTLTGGNA
ncbi:S-layer homology domain-containing protein [uncultured Intestinimonas sp.]|uniref:S-layer homology domain-containing protein n=1 Tax=uncultured Intestinimonas sp. TaxID=1689265 RepID=UPI0025FD991C|nr:S-layer homology domain-containing protein [uncultured Intestinimonas sp.]